MNRNLQRYKVAALFSVLAALAPVEFSVHGVKAAKASCTDGSCCPEPKSTCIVGAHERADKYYKSSGSCTEILPNVPG